MPTYTGTSGNDTLTGSPDDDIFHPLVGGDTVDGLGGIDTLIVDYSSVFFDPYAGASAIGLLISTATSNGGSFSGNFTAYAAGVTYSNIEHLQVTLGFWHDRFVIDSGALALGATAWVDGGGGGDLLQIDLSAFLSVTMQATANGITSSFGTFLNFETIVMTLTGGADNVTSGASNDTLNGNGGDDVLNGGGGNDVLSGGSGSNQLDGGDGDDRIISNSIDIVDGGAGFDRWSGDFGASTTDIIATRDPVTGALTFNNGMSVAGMERIEQLITGSGNDELTFVGGVNFTAGAGVDRLTVTASAATAFIVADGNGAWKCEGAFSGVEHLSYTSLAAGDWFNVDAAPLLGGATLILDAGGGNDILSMDLGDFASVSFVAVADGTVITNIPATLLNFETFRISTGAGGDTITTGAGHDSLNGLGGGDVLSAGFGNDVLDGGTGQDAMSGGFGNDVYLIDDTGDMVTELAGQGNDEIRVDVDYSLASGQEVEFFYFSAATSNVPVQLIGNEFGQEIRGNDGNNFIDGGGGADRMIGRFGNDTYIVNHGSDTIEEGYNLGTRDVVYARVSYTLAAEVEVEVLSVVSQSGGTPINLTGNGFYQELYGNTDANFLDGWWGADTMQGFTGNDTYVVDHSGDIVIEGANEGTRDVIYARASYTMAAEQHVEVLSVVSQSGGNAIDLTGNAFYQELYGNADANFLDGGAGADSMQGFGGNDTYIVDHSGDDVIEGANEGTRDVIYARTHYTMHAALHVEVLSVISQAGGTAIDLTGNAFYQELYGNTDANFLDGGAGADAMQGFAGNDSYIVDVQADSIVEGADEGTRDVLFARTSYALVTGVGVEVMTTISAGATTAIDLTGNELANEMYGNAGANVLNGLGGNDYLQGFGGADTFAFTTALGVGLVDIIADFAAGTDKVALDDAVFAGIGGAGAFNAAAFVVGLAAADADDRIVYDSATGKLFFDADGNGVGAAVLFAALSGNPALTASDFQVI